MHGYILVYDVTSRPSFDQLRIINDRLLEAIGADTVPRVLVANKTDLLTRADQAVSDKEGQHLARAFGCKLVQTSARTKHNVEHLFETILRQIEATTGTLDEDSSPHAATSRKSAAMCTVL